MKTNWKKKSDGYVMGNVDGKKVYQHRYVWTQANGEIPPNMQIHHINNVRDDNRLENLALVTHQQNCQKMDRAGKGYYYNKWAKKFLAQRKLNGKSNNLGYFTTECGAYMASRMFYITHG